MSQEFDAIYERGVFRPLEQVDLPEQTKVHLQIHETAEVLQASVADDISAKRTALRELVDWVHSRPNSSTDESVTARDHDRILYGWQK